MDNEKKIELKDITIESLEKEGVVQKPSYFDYHIWGGEAKYETIKSYPFTMNVDDIVKDVKETIKKSEPIKGSSIGYLIRNNRKDK